MQKMEWNCDDKLGCKKWGAKTLRWKVGNKKWGVKIWEENLTVNGGTILTRKKVLGTHTAANKHNTVVIWL